MKLISYNGSLLVDPIIPAEKVVGGFIVIPAGNAGDDEQVASGIVVVGSENVPVGQIVYFNRLIQDTIEVQLKGDDKPKKRIVLKEVDLFFGEQL